MKTWLIRIGVALALVLVGYWLMSSTEWADAEVPTPAHGEAETNPLYGVQKLLGELGARVVKRESLDQMPPPQARLVLASRHWDLFPERAKRLHEWVAQGGHLVISSYLVDEEMLEKWLPLKVVEKIPGPKKPGAKKPADDEDEDDEEPEEEKPKGKLSKEISKLFDLAECRTAIEPDAVPASYAGGREFRLCGSSPYLEYEPSDKKPPLWLVRSPRIGETIRVGVGRGSVTVLGSWDLMQNEKIVRGDNGLFMAAALQVRTGSEIWFVHEEAREPLVEWLWHRGWAALALAALALAVAIWRMAVRFGPLAPTAGTHRRSMAEQVRGTAGFLHMHGSDALHAAQLRALHESATRQLRRYHALGEDARPAAIARATGLDAAALVRAMAQRARSPGAMSTDLEYMETARRRLDANGPFTAPAPSSPSSTS